jgi:natural product precursor
MKTKKFEEKLTLNKKTIADLNSSEMNGLKGGQIIPDEMSRYYTLCGCPTKWEYSCFTYCGSCPCQTGVEDGH